MSARGFIFGVLVLISGCASINRAAEYQAALADARNYSTTFEIQISVHPRDDTLLINPRVYVMSGPLITPPEPGVDLIRRVAVEFMGDTGCVIGDVRQMARPWLRPHFSAQPILTSGPL